MILILIQCAISRQFKTETLTLSDLVSNLAVTVRFGKLGWFHKFTQYGTNIIHTLAKCDIIEKDAFRGGALNFGNFSTFFLNTQ